ncbi:11567_t:CDS:2, partial [Funneliformis mosseae]
KSIKDMLDEECIQLIKLLEEFQIQEVEDLYNSSSKAQIENLEKIQTISKAKTEIAYIDSNNKEFFLTFLINILEALQ